MKDENSSQSANASPRSGRACPPLLLPERIDSIDALEDLLSRPTPEVIDAMRRIEGDILLLGVGGKIGPSLARMARRASDMAGVPRRIVGVARFSSADLRRWLESNGIETIACDLLGPLGRWMPCPTSPMSFTWRP